MDVLFFILAIVFFVLWRKAKKALQIQESLDAAKATADEYVKAKTIEGDEYVRAKTKEGDEYYWSKIKKTDEQVHQLNLQVHQREAYIKSLNERKADLLEELETLRQDTLCAMTTVDSYSDLKSDEIKNKLALLKVQEDEVIKSDQALIVEQDRPKKIIDSQKKQILRCFNAEVSSIIGSISVSNIDTTRNKLQKSFDALNKIFSVDGVQISQKYFSMKLEEMSLVYAYMVKLEEEKEQKKAIREQMVEEEKVRREIEREKQKIEKEENQFNNEVKKLMSYMQKSKDDVERQLYIDKIQELEDKLKALATDKENVLNREQNTRAGFVYIISNIGSFGENVYKIGMTRRLDPMDRISELSSASVPFPFDVHALIFSEDAPALETLLHHHFQAMQVNKVNTRKEFFRIDLEEIKKLVIENHNATVQFVDIPEATEYRETLRIEAEQH